MQPLAAILPDVFRDQRDDAGAQQMGARLRRLSVVTAGVLGAVAPAASAADHQSRIVGGAPAAANAWPSQAHITGSQGIRGKDDLKTQHLFWIV